MNEITIPVTPPFLSTCKEIIDRNLAEYEWAAIESDDMFQSDLFEGGFDATENAFTFSYFMDGNEYWLQLTLEEIAEICDGTRMVLRARPAGDYF